MRFLNKKTLFSVTLKTLLMITIAGVLSDRICEFCILAEYFDKNIIEMEQCSFVGNINTDVTESSNVMIRVLDTAHDSMKWN